jgi:tRNA (mo5U34)-methyltransferase
VLDFRVRVQDLKDRRLFHSPFDFGDGIRTRPWHVERRFRRRLRLLQIPEDLSGMTVLDIGAWDGFFSFEFERRGAARVLAIDTFAWDQGGLECFLLAREHFDSKVDYERLDVHELDPRRIGTFDLVFCAGVLYHLRHPLLALEKIRSVTAKRCILETHQLITGLHEGVPLITFFPGDGRENIHTHGAFPTKAWILQALSAAGFARNEVVYSTTSRLGKKLMAVATNRPQSGRLIVHSFAN